MLDEPVPFLVGAVGEDDPIPLEAFDLPEHCVLLFGQEGPGVSADALERADAVLDIAQFGSTRSINAGPVLATALTSAETGRISMRSTTSISGCARRAPSAA